MAPYKIILIVCAILSLSALSFFVLQEKPKKQLVTPITEVSKPQKSLVTLPCLTTTTTDFNCFYDHYTALVQNSEMPEVFEDIKDRYASTPYVYSQCHQLMHVIGHAAAERYPDINDAFAQGDSFCWSGYYHGVVEEITEKIPTTEITEHLNEICQSIPGKETYSFNYFNCVHGLGHGVMTITQNELFQSLDLCKSLNGDWERTSCYGGVFMENVMVDNENHFTKFLKPADPLYPCNAVREEYKSACWLMQTSYMLKIAKYDFGKVFKQCERADTGYVPICYQSLGRDASGHSVSNLEKTKDICLMGKDDEAKSNCVIGAVKDFMSFYHSDKEARALCSALPANLQEDCFTTVENYYRIF